MTCRIMCILLFSILVFSCSKQSEIKADFTTPEGAILSLEQAYRNKDIEKAVSCKDFYMEAEHMLSSLFKDTKVELDKEIIEKTAEVLELAYRKELEQNGFPDFNGLKSTFPKKVKVSENIYKVTEVCTFPDKGTSKQNILVGLRKGEWKILNPVD